MPFCNIIINITNQCIPSKLKGNENKKGAFDQVPFHSILF